jgi:hypothetical protein
MDDDNSQLVYQSTLAAPGTVQWSCQQRHLFSSSPSTGWLPASRVISGSHQYCLVSCHPRHLWSKCEVGKGNENLVCPSPWDFKRSFMCRKILRHGTSGFTSHPKVCCGFLSPLKSDHLGQARTRNLWIQWQAHEPLHHQGDALKINSSTYTTHVHIMPKVSN